MPLWFRRVLEYLGLVAPRHMTLTVNVPRRVTFDWIGYNFPNWRHGGVMDYGQHHILEDNYGNKIVVPLFLVRLLAENYRITNESETT